MGEINRNNFLRWEGALDEAPFQNIAVNVSASMVTGYDYVDISLLGGATSTFSIDPNSITITSTTPAATRPPRWNAQTGMLRVFRPDVMPGSHHQLASYYFKDVLGNASNEAVVDVDLTLSTTAWRALASSVYCLANTFGVNTGYKSYHFLELYYPGSGLSYVPATTKPNAVGDPDYVAPITDLTACPLPSTAPLTIQNLTPATSPTIGITSVTWKKAPNPDIVFVVNLAANSSTVINFPTGLYDSLEMVFTHGAPITGLGFTWSFSPGQINTISGALTDSNSPITILTPTHAQPGSTLSVQH